MWSYRAETDVRAEPDRLWRIFADVAGWVKWNAGIESIELHGPFESGSQFTMKPPGMHAFRSTLAEVREGESFNDVTEFEGTVVRVFHGLRRLAGGLTRVTYSAEVTGAAADEVGPAVTADFNDVLAALKRLAESPVADSQPAPANAASAHEARQIARRFYGTVDAIAAGRAPLSSFDEIAAADFKAHLPGQAAVDRDGFKAVVQGFGAGFPAAQHLIEDIFAEGDKVAVRIKWVGTHSGSFAGVGPTGKSITMAEMGILQVAGGKVVALWPLFDSLTLMMGVGAVRSAAAS